MEGERIETVIEVITAGGGGSAGEDFALEVSLNGGYDFRNLMDYLHQGTAEATFIFDKEGIHYARSNDTNKVMNTFHIKAHKILRYRFECDTSDRVCVTLPMEDMRAVTRPVAKKDIIEIRRNRGDARFYLGVPALEQGTESFSFIEPVMFQPLVKYELPTYEDRRERRPVSLTGPEFVKACQTLVANRSNIAVYRYPSGIEFFSGKPGMTTGRVRYVGEVRKSGEKYMFKINLTHSTLRNLSKIGNLAGHGLVRIFFEKDQPLKIVTGVGSMGTVRVLVRPEIDNQEHLGDGKHED